MPDRYGTDEPVPQRYDRQMIYPLEPPDPLCLRPQRPGNEAAGRLGASRAMAGPAPLPLLALFSI